MGEGHARHECSRADGLGRLAITLAGSLRLTGNSICINTAPDFTMGRDARIDQGRGCDTPTDRAVLSLWSIQMLAIRPRPRATKR